MGWIVAGATGPPLLCRSGLFQDNIACHVASGLGAGLFAVLCGSPVDVVKSRMMGTLRGQPAPATCQVATTRGSSRAGAPPGVYAGVVDCFVKTFKSDGLLAFYKGFGPNFARLGTWNTVMFLVLEQVKLGLSKHQ